MNAVDQRRFGRAGATKAKRHRKAEKAAGMAAATAWRVGQRTRVGLPSGALGRFPYPHGTLAEVHAFPAVDEAAPTTPRLRAECSRCEAVTFFAETDGLPASWLVIADPSATRGRAALCGDCRPSITKQGK